MGVGVLVEGYERVTECHAGGNGEGPMVRHGGHEGTRKWARSHGVVGKVGVGHSRKKKRTAGQLEAICVYPAT